MTWNCNVSELAAGQWSDALGCRWVSWHTYDARAIVLSLPEHNNPDMGRTIEIATTLCPLVTEIELYCVTTEVATGWYLLRDGEWISRVPAEPILRVLK
jgi:hypothetical protein